MYHEETDSQKTITYLIGKDHAIILVAEGLVKIFFERFLTLELIFRVKKNTIHVTSSNLGSLSLYLSQNDYIFI